MVMVTMSELLSEAEIKALLNLYNQNKGTGRFARLCKQQIIEPNIERINRATGQENDTMFLAYLLEHTLQAIERSRAKAA
jgi:hypothetical protein